VNRESDSLVAFLRRVAAGWRESAKALDGEGYAALTGRANGAEWAADELERQLPGIEEAVALQARGQALADMLASLQKRGRDVPVVGP
jgi:hypothetical protein